VGRTVQLLNERLDDPDLVLLGDKVVQIIRKQSALPPILPPEKALHQENPESIHQDSNPTDVFTQPVENKSPPHRHPRPAANIDLPAPAPNTSPEASMTTGPNGRQGMARWRNPRLQPKTAFSRFPPVHSAILKVGKGSI